MGAFVREFIVVFLFSATRYLGWPIMGWLISVILNVSSGLSSKSSRPGFPCRLANAFSSASDIGDSRLTLVTENVKGNSVLKLRVGNHISMRIRDVIMCKKDGRVQQRCSAGKDMGKHLQNQNNMDGKKKGGLCACLVPIQAADLLPQLFRG